MLYIEENATDENKVLEGVWTKYGGAEFKIASFNSPRYTKARAKEYRDTGFLDENGNIKEGNTYQAQHVTAYNNDPHYIQKLVIKSIAKAILLDWKNVAFNRTDGPVAYSFDSALKMLSSDAAILEFISNFASDKSGTTFDVLSDEEKEALGNAPQNTSDTQQNAPSGNEQLGQSSNSTSAS